MSEQPDDGLPDLRFPLHMRVYELSSEFIRREKRRPTHVHLTLRDELELDGASPENLDRETAGRLFTQGARGTFTRYRGMYIVWGAPETSVSYEEERPTGDVPL